MSNAPEEISAPNSALSLCSQARENAYRAALSTRERDESEFMRANRAEKAAAKAYREAMPSLSGFENIRSFIACVAQGLLLKVFTAPESNQLLYAAQVANSAASRRP
jgi:hypothetical protein